MSVLESMRSGSDSTFMQVVLALVVVSFVFWYAVPQGEQSQVVATVNGTKIMDTQYNREFRIARSNAERRYQRTMSNEEVAALGEQVRQKLIEDEVVLQEAEDLGIEVSDREVALAIGSRPDMLNEEGVFDRQVFERQLKRMQMTRADFEDLIRKDMTREKLRLLVYTGAAVAGPEIRTAWAEANTKVDIQYVKVPARDFKDDVEVGAPQIDQYLTENDVEVKARYDRDFARLYKLPERVTLRLIRMSVTPEMPVADVLPKMNALHEQLVDGADFAELATANSQDPTAAEGGLLAARPVAQLATEEAAALTDVAVGSFSKVFTTPGDVRIFKLEERIAPEEKAYEDVKREIAEAMIREEGAPALAAAFAEEQLLPKWKEAGEPPAELIDANGLISLSTGPIPVQAQPGNPFAPPVDLLNAARAQEPGTVFDEVFENAGTLWVAALVSREDPDAARFELEKDSLAEPVLAQKRNDFFMGWVAAAKGRSSIQ